MLRCQSWRLTTVDVAKKTAPTKEPSTIRLGVPFQSPLQPCSRTMDLAIPRGLVLPGDEAERAVLVLMFSNTVPPVKSDATRRKAPRRRVRATFELEQETRHQTEDPCLSATALGYTEWPNPLPFVRFSRLCFHSKPDEADTY